MNLAIAQETKRQLEALGATVVLTRTADYRITLLAAAPIATSLRPLLFVSIHHNAEPDEARDTPERRRTSRSRHRSRSEPPGLVYEELVDAFRTYDIRGPPTATPGRSTAHAPMAATTTGSSAARPACPAVLSEAAFISNPAEEALLADPAFQKVEAKALTKAIVRFATSDDPGSGYVTPYPRTQPAGPGGGDEGCEDPPLG